MTDSARIDVWLFNVRFYKSRSLAATAVQGGLVHLNDAHVKPAHAIKPGDVIAFRRGSVEFDCEVLSLPTRRGPAPEAQACYRESEASVARRDKHERPCVSPLPRAHIPVTARTVRNGSSSAACAAANSTAAHGRRLPRSLSRDE